MSDPIQHITLTGQNGSLLPQRSAHVPSLFIQFERRGLELVLLLVATFSLQLRRSNRKISHSVRLSPRSQEEQPPPLHRQNEAGRQPQVLYRLLLEPIGKIPSWQSFKQR